MPKIVFSKEAEKYHAVGLAFRQHGIKIGMINEDGMTFGYLDSFYHRSQVKDKVVYRFKHLAKEAIPSIQDWEFTSKDNYENAFIIGLMGEPILTEDGQAAFDYIKRNETTLSINAIEKICGTKGSLKKALDRKQKQFGGSHKLIDWYLSLEGN
jgi:hypothetical protein